MSRNVIHEFRTDFNPPLRATDMPAIRAAISSLMDQAAHAIQLAGYEQDDAEIDRYAEMRFEGEQESRRIKIESLADVESLVSPFIRGINPGKRFPIEHIEIKCLMLQVIADSQALFTDFGQPRIDRG